MLKNRVGGSVNQVIKKKRPNEYDESVVHIILFIICTCIFMELDVRSLAFASLSRQSETE